MANLAGCNSTKEAVSLLVYVKGNVVNEKGEWIGSYLDAQVNQSVPNDRIPPQSNPHLKAEKTEVNGKVYYNHDEFYKPSQVIAIIGGAGDKLIVHKPGATQKLTANDGAASHPGKNGKPYTAPKCGTIVGINATICYPKNKKTGKRKALVNTKHPITPASDKEFDTTLIPNSKGNLSPALLVNQGAASSAASKAAKNIPSAPAPSGSDKTSGYTGFGGGGREKDDDDFQL